MTPAAPAASTAPAQSAFSALIAHPAASTSTSTSTSSVAAAPSAAAVAAAVAASIQEYVPSRADAVVLAIGPGESISIPPQPRAVTYSQEVQTDLAGALDRDVIIAAAPSAGGAGAKYVYFSVTAETTTKNSTSPRHRPSLLLNMTLKW